MTSRYKIDTIPAVSMAEPKVDTISTLAPEMLELILLQLPETQLFVVQRVCSKWRDMIETSPPIRKKMFLAADGDVLDPTGNPHNSLYHYVAYTAALRLNPMAELAREGDAHERTYSGRRRGAPFEISLWGQEPAGLLVEIGLGDKALKEYFKPSVRSLKDKSWKKLLFTQPPCKAISVHASIDRRHLPWTPQFATLYNPTGVTLGDWYSFGQKVQVHSRLRPRSHAFLTDPESLRFWMTFPENDGAGRQAYDSCRGDGLDLCPEGRCRCLQTLSEWQPEHDAQGRRA